MHADPRTGVALYMIALTTLIPTIVHLVAGLGALWTQKSRKLREVAQELGAQPEGVPFSGIEISDMKHAVGRATHWGYAAAALVVGVGSAIVIGGAYVWFA